MSATDVVRLPGWQDLVSRWAGGKLKALNPLLVRELLLPWRAEGTSFVKSGQSIVDI